MYECHRHMHERRVDPVIGGWTLSIAFRLSLTYLHLCRYICMRVYMCVCMCIGMYIYYMLAKRYCFHAKEKCPLWNFDCEDGKYDRKNEYIFYPTSYLRTIHKFDRFWSNGVRFFFFFFFFFSNHR